MAFVKGTFWGRKSFYKSLDNFWLQVHLALLLHTLTQLYKQLLAGSVTRARCRSFYPDWTLKAVNRTQINFSLTSVKIQLVKARINTFSFGIIEY